MGGHLFRQARLFNEIEYFVVVIKRPIASLKVELLAMNEMITSASHQFHDDSQSKQKIK